MTAPKLATPYALMVDRCGLTQSDAARYHDVSHPSVASWKAGRRPANRTVIAELRNLDFRIDKVADSLRKAIARELSHWPKGGREQMAIVITVPQTPRQLRDVGLPFIGCYMKAIGRVVASLEDDVHVIVTDTKDHEAAETASLPVDEPTPLNRTLLVKTYRASVS